MSHYPSMPPPGAYVPPNQNQSTPPAQGYGTHQQQGYQPQQGSATYQPSAASHGQISQSQKTSGGTFGQMMNQAVTTSKPMFNKLSKTISSKLGNKAPVPGTPQHLQSYQNYQQQYGQQTQAPTQPQSHTFNPQAQQQSQAPSTYAAQQSPYQQASYGAGQGNYFTQQAPTTPQTPYNQATPPPQQAQASYNNIVPDQNSSILGEQQVQMQQAQHQGQINHIQSQAQGQHHLQPLHAQHTGQQTGVIGNSQHLQQQPHPQSPPITNTLPHSPALQQPQWQSSNLEQSFPSTYQQHQHQHQQQQPSGSAGHEQQSYFPSTNVQVQHSNQNWTPLPPAGSEGPGHSQLPPASISPPPIAQNKPQTLPSVSPPQSHNATPAPQTNASTDFIAELPADVGNLSIAETKPLESASLETPVQNPPYQAYQSSTAQIVPSSPGFTIARRAVSISNVPFADPWRFADPLTELPTREFYVIADLLFDALDRKFEPQNTGMLEASKILKSWIDLNEDATQLFSYRSYSAFGKLWSLQGIPHIMVPVQPSLTPIWNFNQHSHAHELKLSSVHPQAAAYAIYMPALNRTGWYKFFFLEMMHGPDNINKLLPTLCSETYKPGVLHHPDLTRRDKAEAPALQARAVEIQTLAINQWHVDVETTGSRGNTWVWFQATKAVKVVSDC